MFMPRSEPAPPRRRARHRAGGIAAHRGVLRALLAGACLTGCWSAPALAATEPCTVLEARFIESAPRDRFVFENRSRTPVRIVDITLELAATVGRLIFDTQDGGSGVEVFQPFRTEAGEAVLAGVEAPDDGADRLVLRFERFSPGDGFTFSIDVDDRLPASELGQIRVAGSEIAGAVLLVGLNDAQGRSSRVRAVFGPEAKASAARDGTCDAG